MGDKIKVIIDESIPEGSVWMRPDDSAKKIMLGTPKIKIGDTALSDAVSSSELKIDGAIRPLDTFFTDAMRPPSLEETLNNALAKQKEEIINSILVDESEEVYIAIPSVSEIRERIIAHIPEAYGKVKTGTPLYDLTEAISSQIRELHVLLERISKMKSKRRIVKEKPEIDYDRLVDLVIDRMAHNKQKEEMMETKGFLEELKKL